MYESMNSMKVIGALIIPTTTNCLNMICSLAAGYESNCYFKAHDEKVVNIKVKVKVYTRVLAA